MEPWPGTATVFHGVAVAVLGLLLAGCDYLPPVVWPSPPPVTSPTPTPPSPSPQPSPPVPSPSPLPSATPSPAPTATPEPVPSPSPCTTATVVPTATGAGCKPCAPELAFLETVGYAPFDRDPRYLEMDNCRSGDLKACTYVSRVPVSGYPACTFFNSSMRPRKEGIPPANGICGPEAPRPAATPSPCPSATPDPGAYFNCNGEYEVPESTCGAYRTQRISVGVHIVARAQQVVAGCKADDKCPAQVGDRITVNASPRFNDPRCTRGAVIPGNCVVLFHRNVADWSVSRGSIEREDDERANGWLGQFKPDAPGTYRVKVCVGAVCGESDDIVVGGEPSGGGGGRKPGRRGGGQ